MSTKTLKRTTLVKATSCTTGEIRLFTSSISAARHLGCSKMLIYAVLYDSQNCRYYHSTSGWNLELVDIQAAILTYPNIDIES